MTEPYGYDDSTDDTDDDGSERYVQLKRSQIKALERDAKLTRTAQSELETARRELALAKAGLGDLSPARQKALLASIDGELTADAARTAAEELGFIAPVATPEADADGAAMDRLANASNGASGASADEDAVARLHRAAAEGGQAAVLAQIAADGHLVSPAG